MAEPIFEVTTCVYDSQHQLQYITYPDGTVKTWEQLRAKYADINCVAGSTDGSSWQDPKTVTSEEGSGANRTEPPASRGRLVTFTYDISGNVRRFTNLDGSETEIRDTIGNLKQDDTTGEDDIQS